MKKIRNILSIALVFVMLIGFAPVNVFADGPTTGGSETQTPGTGTTVTPTPAQPGEGTPGSTGTPGGSPENPQQPADGQGGNTTDPNTPQPQPGTGTQQPGTDPSTQQPAQTTYTVSFDRNGHGTAPSAQTVNANGTANVPTPAPTAEGFRFDGWYKEAACTTPYDFTTPVTESIILYAKWTAVVVEHDVVVRTIGNGTAKATPNRASKNTTITVTADPDSGYVVDSIVVKDQFGHVLDLRNFVYKNYYNNYPFWYDRFGYKNSYRYNFYDYRSWCYNTDRTVRSYTNYKTWCRLNNYTVDEDDYDDFIYWYDRYDDDDYYNWRYDRSYTYYDKADFTMPDSAVTVEVTFTSAPYWRGGYYYDSRTGTYRHYYDDDYYYYRYRRNKKSNYYERQAKADEEKDKAEEEKKAPVLKSETRAIITIGSTILNKADMSGQSIMAMDVAAYVKDGRTMLPIRYVAEALGLQVSWVKETRTVLVWDGINRIEIPVDTNKMIVNSVPYINDVKPEMKNGRTMLAVANIARMLGLQDGQDITWDAGKQQVTFVRKIYSK